MYLHVPSIAFSLLFQQSLTSVCSDDALVLLAYGKAPIAFEQGSPQRKTISAGGATNTGKCIARLPEFLSLMVR